MTSRWILVLAVVVLCGPACSRKALDRQNAGLRPGSLARSNLLLVTIDTLRADHVGAYAGGARTSVTPTLDALAARGIRFTHAYAHAPMTQPAHTSILTGLIPPTHGVRTNGRATLALATPTLATLLHDAGYRTGAFIGAFVLDARFGLNRGFDTYDDRVGSDTGPITFAFAERSADRVTQLAGDWITSASTGAAAPAAGAWFCWVHLFDPHAPYRAPEQRVPDPYDNEVAFADAKLGALFDRLRAAGQLDSTLIIVVADHGESLGDHGEATHGLFAYDATIKIPLIMAGPSIRTAVSDAAVGQADLLPTAADLLGVPPPPHIDGQSMLPAIRGEATVDHAIYFEALDAYLTRNWAPLTGVIADGWKYIDLPEPELYELGRDPGEQQNRVHQSAERATALGRRLAEWPDAFSARLAPSAPIDPDAAARLRSLGYTSSQNRAPGRKRYTSPDDPKHLMDLDRRYERALTFTGERQYGEAARLLEAIIAERADFTAAYLNLASVYIAAGVPRRAVTLLEDAATRGVTTTELQGRLGSAYLASGDPQRAEKVLSPVAQPDIPGGLEAMNTLGVALTQQGRFDRARRLFSDVLQRSPRSATTLSNLGLLELTARRKSEAASAFEQAVAADPRLAQAWEGLGAARVEHDPAGAIEAWGHAVELEPHNYDVLFNLAVTLRDQGRGAEARPLLERFVREAPESQYARDIALVRRWLAG